MRFGAVSPRLRVSSITLRLPPHYRTELGDSTMFARIAASITSCCQADIDVDSRSVESARTHFDTYRRLPEIMRIQSPAIVASDHRSERSPN